MTASIALPEASYKEDAAIASFYEGLLNDLRSTPGVTAAGAGSDLPWTGWDDNAGFDSIQGEVPLPNQSSTPVIMQRRPAISARSGFRWHAAGCSISPIRLTAEKY